MKKLIWVCFYLACSSCARSQNTVIAGNVSGIPAKVLYLVDAYNYKKRIDSAVYGDDKFLFNISKDVEPFLASIVYTDNNNYTRKLLFLADKSEAHPKAGTSSFMVENGISTKISGDWGFNTDIRTAPSLKIEGGKQNDFYQTYMHDNVGHLKSLDPKTHDKEISIIQDQIRNAPYSFYLLRQINTNQSQYSKEELDKLLSLFNDEVQSSKQARSFKIEISNKYNGGPVDDLSLYNGAGILKHSINKKKKINMLIFWASWCYPCLLEVPQLKKLFAKIDSTNFNMVSISLDSDTSAWNKALKTQNMPWEQFLIPINDMKIIKIKYRISSIPLVIFLDELGNEIKRFDGYSESNYLEYKKLTESKSSNGLN